jgi:hypothetical protein
MGDLLMAKRANQVAWGLAVSLAVAIAGGIAVAAPRSRSPRTVVDYYMLLPDEYFEPGDRRSLLKRGIVDIKNGYLRPGHDGAQWGLEICLFKRPERGDLIAVNGLEPPDDGWTPWIHFLTYRNGRLVDVTDKTLPRCFNKRLGYELPRHGTTIKVVTEAGKRVYDLVWAKGRFRVKPAGRRA